MERARRNGAFAHLLEVEVTRILEEEASSKPWSGVDKSKLPAACFLWVEDPGKKSTWHLPYREGDGGVDPTTGMYRKAGPVNINALRAVAAAVGGARTGEKMTIPSQIRRKIENLLKQYKIGKYAEHNMTVKAGRELIEEGLAKQFADVQIDKQSATVKGVAILRSTSRNCTFKEGTGRRYTEQAMASTAKLISGAKAYVDHPTQQEFKERGGVRSVRDLLGYYENGRVEGGVVRADLRYLKNHATWFEPLVEQMADKVGKSIHAYGPTYLDEETKVEVVEDIEVLASADLVTEPGSTLNLFEAAEETVVEEEVQVKIEDLTLADLEEGNPDLVKSLREKLFKEQDAQNKTATLAKQVEALGTENKALKMKLDEYEVAEKVRKREADILKLVNESGIPKEHATAVFLDSLRGAKDEQAMKALIEDRKKLIAGMKKPGVTGMGAEGEVITDEQQLTEAVVKADEEELAAAVGAKKREGK